MIKKEQEKIEAISLRKQGLSYNEILKKVPVAKSTLSVWLKEIGVAKKQQQVFTLKRKLAQQKAQEACRRYRMDRESKIIEQARGEIFSLGKKDLWIIGIVLYWAEGAKQKDNNVSQRVSFANSDPKIILIFDRWIKEICKIKKEDVYYCIYIHETANIAKAKLFWENLLNTKIDFVYTKKHNPKTNRKFYKDYNGLFRIDIKRSTDLNRKIKGWILGIADRLEIKI